MASAFGKDLRRSIAHSWGRFLAIAIIAALGAGFYAGLRMTGPDMRLAGDEYYDGTSLADVRVVSTIGFDEAQIDALRDVEGVSAVMPAREADAISELDGVQYTLCFQSLDVDAAQASTCDDGFTVQSSDGSYLNRPVLKSGTWPTKSDECLLSSDTVWQTDVHIGDKVRLIEGTQDLDDSFAEREFTVVGFVNSSYYTCSTNVGSTPLGSGRLTSFVFVPDSAFADDYPITEAFVAVDRYVYGVVRHIQKEGLIVFLGLVKCSYSLLGECFGDESSGSPVLLQTRYGHKRSRFAVLGVSVVQLAQVCCESSGSVSGNVHFKSPVCRVLARSVHSAEMRLAAMYGVIAAVAQQFYERCAHVGVWRSCHLRNAVDVPVGTVNHVAR